MAGDGIGSAAKRVWVDLIGRHMRLRQVPTLLCATMLLGAAACAPRVKQAAAAPPVTADVSSAQAQAPAPSWIGLGYSVRQEVSPLGDFREVRVDTVAPGSPAEQAGLVTGDVILAVDGRPAAERLPLFRDAFPGRRYDLRVKRGGAEIDVALVAAPPRQAAPRLP